MKDYKHRRLCVAALAIALVVPTLAPAQITKAEPAAPKPPPRPAAVSAEAAYEMFANDAASLPAKPTGAALVILKEAGDTKDLTNIEEDLNVMARILAKAAAGAGDQGRSAMGIAIRSSMFGSGASPQNIYLEGYGALFFLTVNYPLVAPPAKSPDAEAKNDTSSEWEEARRELYQPRVPGIAFDWANSSFSVGGAEPYDADKVEQLKTDLITALKNAAHIRKLKSDESVTVVVNGRSRKSVSHVVINKPSGGGGGRGGTGMILQATDRGDGQKTELILRAKRSDIDSFQKDKINLDEFRKHVIVMVH